MQTSANSTDITHICLLDTQIQKTSRQARDFIVFLPIWQKSVCAALLTLQRFKDKDVGEISGAALENTLRSQFFKVQNQATAGCLLSDSCILSNCIAIIDALSGNLILQQLIVELILAALDEAT